tara:strand:+ start:119 stop:472 length:354 start_codon:yes stop_codon:yes gene_type:complete
MKITPDILENMYATIYCCYPYTKWNMPLPEQIKFEVSDDPTVHGTYIYDDGEKFEHIITISRATCGHFMTVFRTLAHEAVHMSRWNHVGEKWLHHDKVFRQRCKMVANELGLDPLEL